MSVDILLLVVAFLVGFHAGWWTMLNWLINNAR